LSPTRGDKFFDLMKLLSGDDVGETSLVVGDNCDKLSAFVAGARQPLGLASGGAAYTDRIVVGHQAAPLTGKERTQRFNSSISMIVDRPALRAAISLLRTA
jgi:hypothetical protein